MRYVEFTKHGLIRRDWDGETETYASKPVGADRVLACLRMECKIAEGVTLLDIFNTVDTYTPLVDFMWDYSWCPVAEFHEQARLPRPEDDDTDHLEYLEIRRILEVERFPTENPVREMYSRLDFSAPGIDDGRPVRFSFKCSPMNEIGHLPVRLVDRCPLEDTEGHAEEEFETSFSLLEVLDAIYHDISFFGGPTQVAAFCDKLGRRHEDIDSGEATTIPIEEPGAERGLDKEEEAE